MRRFEQHKLAQTLPHKIYSEASLGKAYLREMGIRPWRPVQPDFDPKITGAIMSSYFGGRAEVHRRREIVRALYCDFASMYPTVCTLMGLWKFVIANGMMHEDATEQIRVFLENVSVADLQRPDAWKHLRALMQVRPDEDIFPVRARYGQEQMATIGVNYLSADRPLWFTLADCVASKLLTGRAPKVIQAIRFEPKAVQDRLRSVTIAGNEQYRVNPAVDDFYKRVIDMRRSVKQEDTDSMAFAEPEGMALSEFEKRVRKVCAWFEQLNPYEQPGSILEFEDQNFTLDAADS